MPHSNVHLWLTVLIARRPAADTRTYGKWTCSMPFEVAELGDHLKRPLALEILLAEKELLNGNGSPVPDKRKPLFIAHDTGDSFIYSKAERGGRKWFGPHWGKNWDGGRECDMRMAWLRADFHAHNVRLICQKPGDGVAAHVPLFRDIRNSEMRFVEPVWWKHRTLSSCPR